MSIQICGAPCLLGCGQPQRPYLPPCGHAIAGAGKAGYSAIELGPYGYLPIDAELVENELKRTVCHRRQAPFSTSRRTDNQESVLRMSSTSDAAHRS